MRTCPVRLQREAEGLPAARSCARGVGGAWALLVVQLCLVIQVAALGAEQGAEDRTGALIRELGAASYAARERAADELRRIGSAAMPALEKAAQSDDPEVRLRAQDILRDLRLGIAPDWPPEAVLIVRHYARVAEKERPLSLVRLCDMVGEKAVPFLLSRMAEGLEAEAKAALEQLKRFPTEQTRQQVMALVGKPVNAHQARALAWALAQSQKVVEALKVLAEAGLQQDGARQQLVEDAVKGLIKRLGQGDFGHVAQSAPEIAKLAPDDARFVYLEAEALVALDKDGDAKALYAWAASFNPAEEAPHYQTALMLEEMGRRRFAAGEWKKMLEIPPNGGVYDMNAHLHLGGLCEASGLYGRGADYLEKGLKLFGAARKAGEGMCMIGGSEDKLREKAKELRQKAQRFPVPKDAPITDEREPNSVHINIGVSVKDGKLAEMCRALRKVDASISMKVQPYGLKLLDEAPVTLQFDAAKRELSLLLGQSRCAEPVPFEPKGNKAMVAVSTLDCCYVFDVNADSGKAERVARYEKDYVVKLQPGIKLAACSDVTVSINDKQYEWKELLAGVKLDFLPEKFHLVIEGTAPSGRHIKIDTDARAEEPEVASPDAPETE